MDPMTEVFLYLLIFVVIGFGLTVYFDRRSKKKR